MELSEIKVIAHRGWSARYPQNSFSAVKFAFERNPYGIEVDIVMTKNLMPVLSHDPFADWSYISAKEKYSHEKEKFANFFQLNSRTLTRLLHTTGEEIPHLPDFLHFMQMNTFRNGFFTNLYLDLKSEPELYNQFYPQPDVYAKVICDYVKPVAERIPIILMSADLNLLRELAKRTRKIRLFYVADDAPERILKEKIYKRLSGIALNFRHWTNELADIFERDGKEVNLWTINRREDYEKLPNYRFNAVTTDYPSANLWLADN